MQFYFIINLLNNFKIYFLIFRSEIQKMGCGGSNQAQDSEQKN